MLVDLAFSEHDDVKMGKSIDRELKSQRNIVVLKNDKIQKYVQYVTKEVLRSPHIKRKDVYPYKVTILDDDNVVNAFCTPGGYIYIYTGLLKFLENEASLAAVIAHEIAHAEKRHARQRMLSQLGIQIIIAILLQDSSSQIGEIAAGLAGNLTLLANSRSDEIEADEWGFKYMETTPYYQAAMSYFFDKIKETQGEGNAFTNSINRMLSTHPLPDDRLKKNAQRIKKYDIAPPSPSNLFTRRYKKVINSVLTTDIQ